jgi:Na+-translocating ferredoxin:NAD+ oxidoreductase RnfG subunit
MVPRSTGAEVFHSRESALKLAFPEADSVDKREVFLICEKKQEVEVLARAKLSSRLVTIYGGRKEERVQGYAFIETHTVRSLPETILIVLDPNGNTQGIHLLAFHEPPEYAPSARWLGQFQGRPLTDELSLRGEVAGISGATITATAITAAARRILAIYQEEMGSGDSEANATKKPKRQLEGR